MTGQDPREPAQLSAALDSLGIAFRHPLHTALRVAANGQNPPLCAQLVWQLLHSVPRSAARHPGSAVFRAAMRSVLEQNRLYLEPTRTDVAAGVTWLHRRDLLPEWVRWDAQGGAAAAHRS